VRRLRQAEPKALVALVSFPVLLRGPVPVGLRRRHRPERRDRLERGVRLGVERRVRLRFEVGFLVDLPNTMPLGEQVRLEFGRPFLGRLSALEGTGQLLADLRGLRVLPRGCGQIDVPLQGTSLFRVRIGAPEALIHPLQLRARRGQLLLELFRPHVGRHRGRGRRLLQLEDTSAERVALGRELRQLGPDRVPAGFGFVCPPFQIGLRGLDLSQLLGRGGGRRFELRRSRTELCDLRLEFVADRLRRLGASRAVRGRGHRLLRGALQLGDPVIRHRLDARLARFDEATLELGHPRLGGRRSCLDLPSVLAGPRLLARRRAAPRRRRLLRAPRLPRRGRCHLQLLSSRRRPVLPAPGPKLLELRRAPANRDRAAPPSPLVRAPPRGGPLRRRLLALPEAPLFGSLRGRRRQEPGTPGERLAENGARARLTASRRESNSRRVREEHHSGGGEPEWTRCHAVDNDERCIATSTIPRRASPRPVAAQVEELTRRWPAACIIPGLSWRCPRRFSIASARRFQPWVIRASVEKSSVPSLRKASARERSPHRRGRRSGAGLDACRCCRQGLRGSPLTAARSAERGRCLGLLAVHLRRAPAANEATRAPHTTTSAAKAAT
jgi:hypothetical protein